MTVWHISAVAGLLAGIAAGPAAAQPRWLDQGAGWNDAARTAYYTQDQGSRIMPLAWMAALKRPDGSAFLADSLARYGYLPGPLAAQSLPVGFTTGQWQGETFVGMTCSACHTRQIEIGGAAWRLDGGPAIVDFQAFLSDLDADVARVLADQAVFADFAVGVLGAADAPPARDALRAQIVAWQGPFHTLIERALPTPAWGPGRLDAVSMIFNRLTGLDIGPGPDHVIAGNIRRADAPTRYPFLWNASIQDHTQWPGFAANGSDLLALGRNLGEVIGVFADFKPKPFTVLSGIDFRGHNSANFDGLGKQEQSIKLIGPPVWPFYIDDTLRARGEAIFNSTDKHVACAACHGVQPGVRQLLGDPTWKTPLQDVGTDTREHSLLTETVDTGVLAGASIPLVDNTKLQPIDTAFNALKLSVLGSIVEHYDPLATGRTWPLVPPGLTHAFEKTPSLAGTTASSADPYPYESRVMQGIWAVAPYLHNGSVPTLADLLLPASQRPARFKIGPAYDLERVGMARAQTRFGEQTLVTTGCEDRGSGNSRCGHEFGTHLSAGDKRALLKYLKSL